ncbi:MAG: adenylosuccinate synthetase [Thermoanaerobaculia bacterium]
MPSLAVVRGWADRLAPFVADTGALLGRWRREGASIPVRGEPREPSSTSITGPIRSSPARRRPPEAWPVGSGVPPAHLDGVLGVLKAYDAGGRRAVPSELHDESRAYLREQGNEFGTTTGRPRRCGWLDLVAGRYACEVNGASDDRPDQARRGRGRGDPPLRRLRDRRRAGRSVSRRRGRLERAQPILETVPGWNEDTAGLLEFEDLPGAARAYVERVESVGAPISLISTGPRRRKRRSCATSPAWSSSPAACWTELRSREDRY